MPIFNKVQVGLVAETLAEIDSTNAELVRRLSGPDSPPAGFVLKAHHQSQGRGQANSQWFSQIGANWTASILLRPTHLKAEFVSRLSQVCSLAVRDTVASFLSTHTAAPTLAKVGRPAGVQKIKIKWPNDVLVNGHKIAGILIQTGIQGQYLGWAVLGIGLNVNQTSFPSDLARPATSLAQLTGQEQDLNQLETQLLERLQFYYEQTQATQIAGLDKAYQAQLFQRNEMASYRDLSSGRTFVGQIRGTDPQGRLQLDGPDGRLTTFDPKTIAYL